MFQVLAFVYENFWGGDACPELPTLQRKLHAVGFESQEVVEALVWLEGLKSGARGLHRQRSAALASSFGAAAGISTVQVHASDASKRVFTAAELERLGVAGWGLLAFLVSVGALAGERLELVMDRAMAASGDPISRDALKLIVLMVYWSLNEVPDDLVFDELCDNRQDRLPN
jgi:Smg protein